jgi:hypothetical protein
MVTARQLTTTEVAQFAVLAVGSIRRYRSRGVIEYSPENEAHGGSFTAPPFRSEGESSWRRR